MKVEKTSNENENNILIIDEHSEIYYRTSMFLYFNLVIIVLF